MMIALPGVLSQINAPKFDWGSETADGDSTWWLDLKNWIQSANDSELSACVGKTKSVTLTTAVQNTTTHLVRCIGYGCDGNKTLTFQTANCLRNSTSFGGSGFWMNSSTARSLCNDYYNAFPNNDCIKIVSKGTCATLTTAQNGAPTYNQETVFLPSFSEMGFDAGSPSSFDEFCIENTLKIPYQYYSTDDFRRKTMHDNDTTMCQYWTRSIANTTQQVCVIYYYGSASSSSFYSVLRLAPAFVIG